MTGRIKEFWKPWRNRVLRPKSFATYELTEGIELDMIK